VSLRQRLWPYAQLVFRRLGPVRFEDLRRVRPVSRLFGTERGSGIDRRYIDRFLEERRALVRGRVLEVAERRYGPRLGGAGATYDVLHVEAGHAGTTVVGDLARPESLPAGQFDCFICTQTFNFIFEVQAAVAGAARLLRPGGVLLATVAGLCQVSRYDMDRWGDFWRFTSASCQRLFQPHFARVQVTGYGNVLAAKALLDGLAVEDLPDARLLDEADPDYPVVLGIEAEKG
jgi:SAM-dependent methyltransferase